MIMRFLRADVLEKPYLLITPYPSYFHPSLLTFIISEHFIDEEELFRLRVFGRARTENLMGVGKWLNQWLIPVHKETGLDKKGYKCALYRERLKAKVVIGEPFGPCPSEKGLLRREKIALNDEKIAKPYLLGMMQQLSALLPPESRTKGIFREGDRTLEGKIIFDFREMREKEYGIVGE